MARMMDGRRDTVIYSRSGRDPRMDYRDYRDYRDYGRDYYGDYRDYRDYHGDYSDYNDYNDYRDYRDYRDYMDYRDYREKETRGRGNWRDRKDYDYASGKMSSQEIKEWTEDLLSQIDDREKEFFKKDKILKRAEELGIKFDDFSPDEFYATVIMLYTDFRKDIGSASVDPYINMAKDWLKDPDSALKYCEKLTAYHDYIIKGYR